MNITELRVGGRYVNHEGMVATVTSIDEYMVTMEVGLEVWSVDPAYCEHWQPLLTESEWRARHPLSLRKLGEGEALDTGKQYATRMRDTGEWYDAGYPGTLGRETWDNVDIYELPALTSEESEPTIEETFGIQTDDPDAPGYFHVPMKKVGTIRGKFVPVESEDKHGMKAMMDCLKESLQKYEELSERIANRKDPETPLEALSQVIAIAKLPERMKQHAERLVAEVAKGYSYPPSAPAPNSVGERLTEPPEVGTPVVERYASGRWKVFPWEPNLHLSNSLYRWHGPIPQEPTEPEKPKPPKWLGAVRDKDGYVAWVSAIMSHVHYAWQWGQVNELHPSQFREDFTLAPDIMPPSPELAKLFGEEVGE